MDNKNEHPAWMDDETVQNIPSEKLDFISRLFQNGHGKSQKELMTQILPMLKRAKEENLIFTQSELNSCIQAIKKHSSKEELSQIDTILKKNKTRP